MAGPMIRAVATGLGLVICLAFGVQTPSLLGGTSAVPPDTKPVVATALAPRRAPTKEQTAALGRWFAAAKHAENERRWYATVEWNGAVATAAVMRCIKDHESGNYTEHSHPWDGSGAFQVIPGTWADWSVRAGYGTRDKRGHPLPTYALAWHAPPNAQDAVVRHMLRNGGAHNWDPKYGADPCTVDLP